MTFYLYNKENILRKLEEELKSQANYNSLITRDEVEEILAQLDEDPKREILNKRNIDDDTLLGIAIRNKRPDLAEIFIKHGANAEGSGYTQLMLSTIAQDLEAVITILNKGTQTIDQQEKDNGYTALHIAALYGSYAIMDVLIENGANVNIKSKKRELPLILLLESDRIKIDYKHSNTIQNEIEEIEEELKKNNDPSLQALLDHHLTPAQNTLKYGDEILQKLYNSYIKKLTNDDSKQVTSLPKDLPLEILKLSRKYKDKETARILAERGVGDKNLGKQLEEAIKFNEQPTQHNALKITQLYEDGATLEIPLLDRSIHDAIACNPPKNIKSLLELGANLEATDKYGNKALILTVRFGPPENLKALVEAGANLETTDKYGNKALILAALKEETESLKVLVEAGANLETTDKDGNTALIMAAKYNSHNTNLKILVEAGANLESTDKDGRTSLMLKIIKIEQALLKDEGIAVIRSIIIEQHDRVQEILQQGADPYLKDNQGRNSFDLIEKGGKTYKIINEARQKYVESLTDRIKKEINNYKTEYKSPEEYKDSPSKDTSDKTLAFKLLKTIRPYGNHFGLPKEKVQTLLEGTFRIIKEEELDNTSLIRDKLIKLLRDTEERPVVISSKAHANEQKPKTTTFVERLRLAESWQRSAGNRQSSQFSIGR